MVNYQLSRNRNRKFQISTNNKKSHSFKVTLCGAYGTRTRDLLRDRQAF